MKLQAFGYTLIITKTKTNLPRIITSEEVSFLCRKILDRNCLSWSASELIKKHFNIDTDAEEYVHMPIKKFNEIWEKVEEIKNMVCK
jgi:hypothetical protein